VSKKEHPECPHCGQKTLKWAVPTASTWTADFNYVCFNDECPYYVRGWEWMQEQYKTHASYRHCIDPTTGHSRPLPVWSDTALRNDIIYDDDDSGEGVNEETT